MTSTTNSKKNTTIIQFGGTGDLSKRKLLPAFLKLKKKGEKFNILALGRRYSDRKEYLKNMTKNPEEFSFLDYQKYSINDEKSLKNILNYIIKTKTTDIIFNLTLSPEIYSPAIKDINNVLENLKNKNHEIKSKKIVVEKPFGFDLETSKNYNKIIKSVFRESEIYRIDHYLGKEFIQNILSLRFNNDLIQTIWNKNNIDNIQIVVDENLGIEERLDFYQKTGIVRDMIQNHILQIITHLTMSEPIEYKQQYISEEKIKVLKSIRAINKTDYKLGQYKSLEKTLKEKKITKKIPTFIALKLYVDTFDFSGIPIYIRTGKMLGESKSIIHIEFKKFNNKFDKEKEIPANSMVIEIQPKMKIDFNFNVKKPNSNWGSRPVKLNFNYYDTFKVDTPKAYEQALNRVLTEEKSIFPCTEEIEESWKIVENLLEAKENQIEIYEDNSIPEFAHKLLEKDNRKWLI